MIELSTSDLLNVWECGLDQPPVRRALSLLVAACPDVPPDELAKLSIGQRDANLLMLREFAFGSLLECVETCPVCKEQLEFAFRIDDILAGSDINSTEHLSLNFESYEIEFRLPNSLDLMAISGIDDILSARNLLLNRCLLQVTKDGKNESSENLQEEAKIAISAKMSEIDPQANIQLSLTCSSCGYKWQATFDIGSFLWSEINTWARRTLRDVHILASAYGWSEADILDLSSWRRQYYLSMVEE